MGNRTPDLLITSELLCQLSYVGSVDRPKGGNVDSLEADGTSGNRSLARAEIDLGREQGGKQPKQTVGRCADSRGLQRSVVGGGAGRGGSPQRHERR